MFSLLSFKMKRRSDRRKKMNNRIKELREREGLSQTQLAEKN